MESSQQRTEEQPRSSLSLQAAGPSESTAALIKTSSSDKLSPTRSSVSEEAKRLSGTSASSRLSVVTDPLKNHPSFRQRDIDHLVQKAETIVASSPSAALIAATAENASSHLPIHKHQRHALQTPITPLSSQIETTSTPASNVVSSNVAGLSTPPLTGLVADEAFLESGYPFPTVSVTAPQDNNRGSSSPKKIAPIRPERLSISTNSPLRDDANTSSPTDFNTIVSSPTKSGSFGSAIRKVFSPVTTRLRSASFGKSRSEQAFSVTSPVIDNSLVSSPLKSQIDPTGEHDPISPSCPSAATQTQTPINFPSTDISPTQNTPLRSMASRRRPKAHTFSMSSSSIGAKSARMIASEHLQSQLDVLKGDMDVDRIFMVSNDTDGLKEHVTSLTSCTKESPACLGLLSPPVAPAAIDIRRFGSIDVDEIMTMAQEVRKRHSETYGDSSLSIRSNNMLSPDSFRPSSSSVKPSTGTFSKRGSFFSHRTSLFGVASEPSWSSSVAATNSRRGRNGSVGTESRSLEPASTTPVTELSPPSLMPLSQASPMSSLLEARTSEFSVDIPPPPIVDVDHIVTIGQSDMTIKALEDVSPSVFDVDDIVDIAEKMILSARESTTTRKSFFSRSRRGTLSKRSFRLSDGNKSSPLDPASILSAVASAAAEAATAAATMDNEHMNSQSIVKAQEDVSSISPAPILSGNELASTSATGRRNSSPSKPYKLTKKENQTDETSPTFGEIYPNDISLQRSNSKPLDENRRFSTTSAIGAFAAAARRRFSRDILDMPKRSPEPKQFDNIKGVADSLMNQASSPGYTVDVGDLLAVGERASRQFELKQFLRAEGGTSSIVLQDVDRLIMLGDCIQGNRFNAPVMPITIPSPSLIPAEPNSAIRVPLDVTLKSSIANESRFAI